MSDQKLKITVNWFKREILDLKDLSFEIMKIIDTEEMESKGDPLNTLYKIGEEKNKKRKSEFFIVTIESLETKYVLADGIKDRNTRLLYNLPSKLLRVGIIRKDKFKASNEAYFVLKDNDIEWTDITDDIYIYDGPLKASDDIELVILETDRDRRIIKTQHLSILKLSFQTPVQQDQLSSDNENASDVNNSLS
ncbi:MAG: hypothetical protein ACP5I6_00145 [Caldisphaera sp.]|jgi:hypothetical protein|nr:hypothetical protein [Caldisphaera sp.]PMP61244.1 MAG: hypothetical protein C0201_00145 [Caldisphaera sp.]PMP89469.1 MAG: hypothetical protein C0171_07055 [Caldisphaera sp.]